jgi:hypothetical protein
MSRAFLPFLFLAGLPGLLAAQRPRPFEIMDNSLLVEEAFNQEAGIFQNIFLFQAPRLGDGWALEFTQEWPIRSQRHQASFTLPIGLEQFTLGKVMLNYRYQARVENSEGPAFSPRLSVILPTGSEDDDYKWGVQLNLPFSRQYGDVYVHANAGATWERWVAGLSGVAGEGEIGLFSPHAAGSMIWRTRPRLHLLVESVARFEEGPAATCCDTEYGTNWIVSPGVRAARNFGDHQLVVGAGAPIAVLGNRDAAVLLYLSYELPIPR